MSNRLVAVTGAQQGTVFPLTDSQVTIGRESSNWICITDPSSSRKHCSITRIDNDFQVKDLESKNGTFVNGIPIRERLLQHGDRIEVGDAAFIYLVHEDESRGPLPADDEISILPTVRLRIEDALYLHPEKLLTSIPLTARIARGLDTVLRLSRSIQVSFQSEELQQKMLESIFEITPAERAVVLLFEEDSNDIKSVFCCDRDLQKIDSPAGRSLIQLVLQERLAILSNNVTADEKLSEEMKSLATPVTSLIAVPVLCRDQLRGILYLDTQDPGVLFDEDHLQLASAIATIGAAGLENMRYVEKMKEDHSKILENLRFEHSMIGESQAMKDVFRIITKVAPSDSNVLIWGETGTGKELAARAIHFNSPRREKPFVAINCANLSETLLESELFGYEKGAFTGAYAQKKGKLEMADGGTVFLDEIGEMAASLQARLLRVIQEREFERVGGTRCIKVDLRLIAASNKDLQAEIREGNFRQDLFYRINVVQIVMPPLRERREDIPLLASYFASKYSKKCGRKLEGISSEARRCLLSYDWPGNVRELENVMERALVLGSEASVLPEDLPDDVIENSDPQHVTKYQAALKDTKKSLVQAALEQAKGDRSLAARILGVHPNNLSRMMRNLKLKD